MSRDEIIRAIMIAEGNTLPFEIYLVTFRHCTDEELKLHLHVTRRVFKKEESC